jgi:hypothetical protein
VFIIKQLDCDEKELYHFNIMKYLGAGEWEPGLILCEGFCPNTRGYVYVKTAEITLGTHIQKALIMTTSSKLYSDDMPISVKDFIFSAQYQIIESRMTSTHNNEYGHNLISPIEHSANTDFLSTNEVLLCPNERNKLETGKILKSQNIKKLCIEKDFDVLIQSSFYLNSKSQSYLEAFLDTEVSKIKDCIFSKILCLKIGLILFVICI